MIPRLISDSPVGSVSANEPFWSSDHCNTCRSVYTCSSMMKDLWDVPIG